MKRQDLKNLVESYSECFSYASECQKRNGVLLDYKAAADKVIAEQEFRAVSLRDEVEGAKRQRNILAPLAAALAGIAVGYYYAQSN